MSHIIDVLNDAHIISIKYSGDVDLTERMNTVLEACALLKPKHPARLLIDVRVINNTMTRQEQEYFGQYLANKPELKNAKVAVLSEGVSQNPNMVINNTAYLDGYHLVPFISKTEAIFWLDGSIA